MAIPQMAVAGAGAPFAVLGSSRMGCHSECYAAFLPAPVVPWRRRRSAQFPRRSVLCSARPASARADTRLTSLEAWLSASGADMTTLRPVDVAGGGRGRGMVTGAARVKGDWLARVPARLALQETSLGGSRSPFATRVAHDAWAKLPWYARLALRLLVARADAADPRAEYFKELPTSFAAQPLHWDDAALDELQSPRLVRAVREQRDAYRRLYESAGVAEWCSWDEWVWAIGCIRSRAFAGELETAPFLERVRLFAFVGGLATVSAAVGVLPPGSALNGALTAVCAVAMYDVLLPRILGVMSGVRLKRYALVPGVDFMNHSSRVNELAEVSYEYFSDRFVVMCGEEYSEGDEVAISYGAQSNDSFLQYYGFVEEGNPADDYKFDKEVESLLGVTPGSLVARRNTGFAPKVIDEVAARFSGDKGAARTTLADLCRAELDGKPTSLEEDLAMPASATESLRLALTYRIEKKRTLRATISLLEDTDAPSDVKASVAGKR